MFLRLSVSAIVGSGIALSLPASASELTYLNDTGGSAEIYGWIAPVVLSVDDGVRTTTKPVDNNLASTRVGLYLNQDLQNARLRFRFETNLGFRNTSDLTNNPANSVSGFDWTREDLRHIDLIWESPRWGTAFIGQGSMSGDGVAEIDFSGTKLTNYSSINLGPGGFEFTNAATGALTGISVGTVFNSFDATRQARLRYDTPSFGGFKLSVSAGQNLLSTNTSRRDTHYGAAVIYEHEFGTGDKLKAGVAYERLDRDNEGNAADLEQDDFYGSGSLLLQNGLNFTLAAGQRKSRTKAFRGTPASSSPTGTYVYGKIGYIAEFFDIGSTAFSIDYYRGDDRVSRGDDSESWSVGVTQTFPYRIEAYFGYRDLKYADKTGIAYNDMRAIMFGGRWSF